MWLSLPQVAEQAGCARSTVFVAVAEGRLPSVQTGGRNSQHLVRRDHAERFVNAYRVAPSERPAPYDQPGLSERQRQTGISVTHQRWHVERGITNPACELCAAGPQGAVQ